MAYECIVLGTGGAGSAALYHLARRGVKVLGLDRFPPGHDRGSSHGETRMLRLAYFEHPDYVPLLRRAYDLWKALETERGAPLYRETGVVQIGPPDGVVVPGVLQAAREHGLEIEEIDRVPGLAWPETMRAVFEKRAGLLRVEECVTAHTGLAQTHGAELRLAAVSGWRADGGGVVVETDGGNLRADRLVVAPGPWATATLGDLGVKFRVLRKALFWYRTEAPEHEAGAGCPAFYFELGDRHFYGFPKVDSSGLKLAEHTGGTPVDNPEAADLGMNALEQADIEKFLTAHVPGASRARTRHEICFYTMTPDEHFLVDRHPEHPQVVFAAGLSGHGFKFASVLGEILGDLACDGATKHPVGFLSLDRFVP